MTTALLAATTAPCAAAPPARSSESQKRWKKAKNQITVVCRFRKKYSARIVNQPESNGRENSVTTNQHADTLISTISDIAKHIAKYEVCQAGAHFSPGEALPEVIHHDPKLFKITPNKNDAEKPFQKVHHASPAKWRRQLLALFSCWILNEADLLDHPAAVPFTILLIFLAPDSDGIKLIIDRLMQRNQMFKVLLLLLWFSCFGIRGADAQNDGDDGVSKYADEWAFVWTLLVGLVSIAAFGWTVHRVRAVVQRPVQAVPPPAAAAAAPALAPPAIPAPNPGLAIMPNLGPGAPRRSDVRFHFHDRFENMDDFL